MLHIFFSARFSIVIDGLWLGRNFSFYVHMYCYFIIATIILFATFTVGDPFHYIETISRLVTLMKASWLKEVNFIVYFFISQSVVIIFWKTNYRIRTFGDVRSLSKDVERHAILTFPTINN